MDIFLILVILILVISPFIIRLIVKKAEIKPKIVNLSLSLRSEELLGKNATEMLINEFNENNPGIVISIQEEDTPPDIIIFDEGEFSPLVDTGMLAALSLFYNWDDTDNLESEEEHFDEEQVRQIQQTEEFQFAIPLVSFMDMLFYNIEILSSAGFDHPPKTREEYLTYVRDVSRRNNPGVSGSALSLNSEDHRALSRDVFSWIWASGGNFLADENKPSLSSTTSMRAITGDFTFLNSIYREVQLQGVFEKTGRQRLDEFANGQIALMIASTRDIPYLREKMGDKTFGVTSIPDLGSGGRYSVNLSSIYAGINSFSAHTDEDSIQAMTSFLKFLSEKSAVLCAELNAVPGSVLSLIPGDYVKNDPFYSKAWDIFESSLIVQGFSGKPGAEEYETIFLEELKIFFEGGRNSVQTVTAIQQRWDEVSANR